MSIEAPSRPRPLYHSRWGLLPFQQDGVMHAALGPTLAVWDTGTGKTHLGLATAALLFEEDLIDIALVICEQNKTEEWVADFEANTDLRVVPYGGAKQDASHRRKIADAVRTGEPTQIKRGWTIERPQVLISTYETFRNDMAQITKTRNKAGRVMKTLTPHFFTEAMAGKRVLAVYDEMTKVGNRGNSTHQAHALFIQQVRKSGGEVRLVGLTATPIERDPENHYNLGRLLCPAAVGTVASFEKDHVRYRDGFGRGTFKNLTPDDIHREPWVTPLSVKMGSVLHRKRWTDDDVRTQFPEVDVERFVHVRLGKRHQEFYETVRDVFRQTAKDEEAERGLFTLLRMIAGLPISLVHSTSKYARTIVEEVGADGLEALGAAKLDLLVERLTPIVHGEGAQAVAFTFFGPSMIPYMAERLEQEKITVAQNHRGMAEKVRARHLAEFKAGERRVLLSSDAGARGINLPQARYAFEYESALTHSLRTQRLNRVKRIDSRDYGVDRVVFQTLIALDTLEEGIMDGVMGRNEWADRLLGDEDAGEHFVTAAQRKALLAIGRKAAV